MIFSSAEYRYTGKQASASIRRKSHAGIVRGKTADRQAHIVSQSVRQTDRQTER